MKIEIEWDEKNKAEFSAKGIDMRLAEEIIFSDGCVVSECDSRIFFENTINGLNYRLVARFTIFGSLRPVTANQIPVREFGKGTL